MNEIISVTDGAPTLNAEFGARLIEIEKRIKALTDVEKKLKSSLLAAMAQTGTVKIETPNLMINYVAATDRESLDSKALKEELPDIYDRYVKMTSVKPSVRVKVK